MELTPLKYFIKLADVLSFTEAAKELFITQSTLSLSIKQLEEELGVMLFDRIGKKIYLTDAGRDFLDSARKAIEEVAYGIQHLKEMQHVYTGKVRIGLIYSLFPLLNICVLKFTKAFPKAELSLVYSHSVLELVELVNSNKLDFALSYKPQDVSALTESTEYVCLPLCVIAHESHPVAIRKHFSLSDLKDFPLIFLEKELYTRKVIDRMLALYKVKVKPQIEVNSTPLLLEMLRTEHWITILPQDVTVSSSDLRAIPIKEKTEQMHISLLSLKGKRHPFARWASICSSTGVPDCIRTFPSGDLTSASTTAVAVCALFFLLLIEDVILIKTDLPRVKGEFANTFMFNKERDMKTINPFLNIFIYFIIKPNQRYNEGSII